MPRESYDKLGYFTDKEFVFIPITENDDNVYGVYFVSKQHRAMVDDIFAGLYFERMKMPAELTSPGRPDQNDKDKPKEKSLSATSLLKASSNCLKPVFHILQTQCHSSV